MRAAFGGYLGPEMKSKAKQWADETPSPKSLPAHKGKGGGDVGNFARVGGGYGKASDVDRAADKKRSVGSGADLTMAKRRKLPSKDFALPGKGDNGGKGSGSYPVPDANHGRLALSMVSKYGSPAEKSKVRAKVHAKFPNIGK